MQGPKPNRSMDEVMEICRANGWDKKIGKLEGRDLDDDATTVLLIDLTLAELALRGNPRPRGRRGREPEHVFRHVSRDEALAAARSVLEDLG